MDGPLLEGSDMAAKWRKCCCVDEYSMMYYPDATRLTEQTCDACFIYDNMGAPHPQARIIGLEQKLCMAGAPPSTGLAMLTSQDVSC